MCGCVWGMLVKGPLIDGSQIFREATVLGSVLSKHTLCLTFFKKSSLCKEIVILCVSGICSSSLCRSEWNVNVSINDKEIKEELPWPEAVYLWIPDAQNKQ